MPVILPQTVYSGWLDPEEHEPQLLTALPRPFDAGLMTCWLVSKRVNNAKNDDASLSVPEPIGEQ
jgi:putative SOS response-associated peptidase YedK